MCPECIGLQGGDVLLYSGSGLFAWGIKVKTWSQFSHVEVYDRVGTTVASRDGKGVNRYLFNEKNLRAILRPKQPPILDLERGRAWFRTEAIGQPYDWLGLFAFFSARAQGSMKRAMFCSEFQSRFFKKCGYALFIGDSDAVSPGMNWSNPMLDLVWAHPDLKPRETEW
ncbi:MAG: hypothetical protein Q8O42_09475 [Acidobacteriota bacterium]|nr:hypothetical protein [Acidobacteriota bacterium]